MITIVVAGVVIALIWALLILDCWLHWIAVGQRQGNSLSPTSWWAILTMPIWTVQCSRAVERDRRARQQAVKQRIEELKQHLAKLCELERAASPNAPPEMLTELRRGIASIEDLLNRYRGHEEWSYTFRRREDT